MKLTNNQWAGISPAHPQREGRNIMKTVEIIQTVVQDLAKVVNGETVVLLSRTVTDRRIVVHPADDRPHRPASEVIDLTLQDGIWDRR